MKEKREAKKAEEQRLERLRKEQEKTRVAKRTVQTHELQVFNIEFKIYDVSVSRSYARQLYTA